MIKKLPRRIMNSNRDKMNYSRILTLIALRTYLICHSIVSMPVLHGDGEGEAALLLFSNKK